MRAHVVRRRRDGRPIATVSHDDARTIPWRQTIADVAARALNAEHNRGIYFTGAVEFDVTFYLPRPVKFLAGKYAADTTPHLTKPDVGKLARAAEDALSRIVWGDDCQVTDLHARKRYCPIGQHPRAEIIVRGATIASLSDPPSLFGPGVLQDGTTPERMRGASLRADLDVVGGPGCKVTTERFVR
jgi:Holliday junction resolvase RusA-like endonuclease